MKHELVNQTLVATNEGIIAKCTCGWNSGYRFSSLVASACFAEHQEIEEEKQKQGGMPFGGQSL